MLKRVRASDEGYWKEHTGGGKIVTEREKKKVKPNKQGI